MDSVVDFLIRPKGIRPLYLLIPIILYFSIEYFRRITKYYYTPVYFPFALENINPKIALYYGSNYMTNEIVKDDNEAERLKRSVWISGGVSFLISALIIPFFVGWVSAALVTEDEFYVSFIAISLFRIESISRSILDYDTYSRGFSNRKNIVSIVMIFYLVFLLFYMLKGYNDAHNFAQSKDWWQYSKTFFEGILSQTIVQGIVIGVCGGLLTQKIFDNKLRREYINEFQKSLYNDVDEN